jgi:anti-sigma B factor antagonist
LAVLDGEVLSVSFSRELSEVVVSLAGDLYAQSARFLAERLTDVIDQQGNLAVVVDLEAITHVDSPGMGVLVDASRRLRSKGGYLALANPSAAADEILRNSGLATVLTIRKS